MTFLFHILLCSPVILLTSPVAAQLTAWFGEAAVDVLAAPTGDSMRVRLLGTNDWPLNPLCTWTGNSTGADGKTYEWIVSHGGDGLVDGPQPYVNANVVTRCTVRLGDMELGSRRHVLNLYLPYPSGPFSVPVKIDSDGRVPANGEGGDWSDTETGESSMVPPLSFEGNVRLDRAGKLSLEVVFTGGGSPTVPTIDGLLQVVRFSSLPMRQKRVLIGQLERARDARMCVARNRHLRVFQKKARNLVLDAALAQGLASDAEALIEGGCGKNL